jgi:hypothetical protein
MKAFGTSHTHMAATINDIASKKSGMHWYQRFPLQPYQGVVGHNTAKNVGNDLKDDPGEEV